MCVADKTDKTDAKTQNPEKDIDIDMDIEKEREGVSSLSFKIYIQYLLPNTHHIAF